MRCKCITHAHLPQQAYCESVLPIEHGDLPYLAWLSKRKGAAVTPNSFASLEVKLWSECLLSYDSMKRACEKSDLSSSFSLVDG